jgi:hypothetical protein
VRVTRFWGHGVRALAALRGEVQVRFDSKVQGTTYAEHCAGW